MSKCSTCGNEMVMCICPKGLGGGGSSSKSSQEDQAYLKLTEQVATALLERYAALCTKVQTSLSDFINSVGLILNDDFAKELISLLEEGIASESESAVFKEKFKNLQPNRAMLVELSDKLDLKVFLNPANQLVSTLKKVIDHPEQQNLLPANFWEELEILGTPLIVPNPEKPSECFVYFIFPKDKLAESKEKPGIKKDLYLQGDFHGYDTSDGRQQLQELGTTGIMIRKDSMPRNALVNYRYIQLEPSLRGRTPLFDQPPFFGLSAKEEASRLMLSIHQCLYESGQTYPSDLDERYKELLKEFETLNQHESLDAAYQTFLDGDSFHAGLLDFSMVFCGLQGAPFWSLENQCEEQYSKHRTAFLGAGPPIKERVFRVNENPELARLPGKAVVWSSLLRPPEPQTEQSQNFAFHNSFYSKLDGKLHPSDEAMKADASNTDLFHSNANSPYSDCTRAIHVFTPTSGQIEKVVVVNDGMNYLSMGVMEDFEKMAEAGSLSPNTAFIFVTTLPALEQTLSQTKAKAKLQGLGAGRTVDYELQIDDYAAFIRDILFPGLKTNGIELPEEPCHRVMVGSSLAGTGAINLGLKHPDLFGGIIAQSPSASNRSCVMDLVASDSVQLHLSCGLFEQPIYAAANANLMFAEELAAKFGVNSLHVGANGHYFLAWTKALEQALPETFAKMLSTNEVSKSMI